jgi:putative sigma-54 modulation protein
MNDYVNRKLEGLHLDYPKIIEAHVILEVVKYRHSAEVILVCSNHITIEAREETNDMYAAIDAASTRSAVRCASTRRA